ncbi:MAG TPA: [Fe-Fe] hydrogenase large subunit C-terminal domain-containing protein [bacterium]|nr:[Fe-Fe] hydrogenase large subunit C-terminal domain-containing protein [bacterium]
MTPELTGLVLTIPEKCRVCYTCVRECPAKAIRIRAGQAEVVPERCIGCGNCVRVCSQHAKRVYDSATLVRGLLDRNRTDPTDRSDRTDAPLVACVAPSFPAEFGIADYQSLAGIDHRRLVGMIRRLGFDRVVEVAYGADLVARRYRKLISEQPNARFIATTCPAIVLYVEKYHPELVPFLAPVVSPMIATARVVHKRYGADARVVFIGPCIAKKAEAAAERYRDDVTAALTFMELRQLFEERGVTAESVEPSEFDPPHPGKGMLFSVKRGILQAAGIEEDLVAGDVVAADGGSEFGHALHEFSEGHLDVRLLEVLSCKGGCIMGAGAGTRAPLFSRRAAVSRYVRERLAAGGAQPESTDVDLNAWFYPDERSMPIPSQDEIASILTRMGKKDPGDELNCGACGYETCREHAIAIFDGLAESEMCLPATIARLNEAIGELGVTNRQLASAQQALVQSEKLASMGQLAAGIAHEVNNPLGVVLLYSQLLLEECDPNSEQYADLKKVAEQADRCKKIVSGLLNFARKNQVNLKPVRIDEFMSACRHAVVVPERVKLVMESRVADADIELDPDQMMQVFTNLMNNAIEAMPGEGILTVRAEGDAESVQVSISDTGVGIPKENVKKVFEPFFTTKQGGKGTGLGLAICYGIVKMHRGSIVVQSNTDPRTGPTGTTMTVKLPRHPQGGLE